MTLAKLLLWSVTAFFFFGACALLGICGVMLEAWCARRSERKREAVVRRPDWLGRFRK